VQPSPSSHSLSRHTFSPLTVLKLLESIECSSASNHFVRQAALVVIVGVLDLVEGICGFTCWSGKWALALREERCGRVDRTSGEGIGRKLYDEASREEVRRIEGICQEWWQRWRRYVVRPSRMLFDYVVLLRLECHIVHACVLSRPCLQPPALQQRLCLHEQAPTKAPTRKEMYKPERTGTNIPQPKGIVTLVLEVDKKCCIDLQFDLFFRS